jgi:hypothetical protein
MLFECAICPAVRSRPVEWCSWCGSPRSSAVAGSISCKCWQADGVMIAQKRRSFPRSCSERADGPFVVLFEQDRSDEADDGVLVGEDPDHFGALLDLTADALDWIGRVHLGAMPFASVSLAKPSISLNAPSGHVARTLQVSPWPVSECRTWSAGILVCIRCNARAVAPFRRGATPMVSPSASSGRGQFGRVEGTGRGPYR